MKLSEFVIGETFWTSTGEFRCTDIGTRVVVAIAIGPRASTHAEMVDGRRRHTTRMDDGPSWLNGPPYAAEEIVFNEYDLPACFRTEAELKANSL